MLCRLLLKLTVSSPRKNVAEPLNVLNCSLISSMKYSAAKTGRNFLVYSYSFPRIVNRCEWSAPLQVMEITKASNKWKNEMLVMVLTHLAAICQKLAENSAVPEELRVHGRRFGRSSTTAEPDRVFAGTDAEQGVDCRQQSTRDDGWHLCKHLACLATQLNAVERHRSKKSLSQEQLGLASPLNYAAIQGGKTKTPLR